MTKTNRLLLIDGDNMLYRAYFKFGNLHSEGQSTGIIFGFPYMVRSLITKFKPNKIIAVFDGGCADYRRELLPGYKVREPKLGFDADSFRYQKEVVRELMMVLNCYVVWRKGCEADDLIYHTITHHPDWDITLVSADKDFHQLIREGLSVWYPPKDILLTSKNLKRYFPYTPEECLDYLCLIGDDSDKIPNIPQCGEKTARKFLDTYGSIKNWWPTTDNPFRVSRDQAMAIIKRNKRLISLRWYYLLKGRKQEIPYMNTKPKFDMVWVGKIARQYQVNTLIKTDFIEGFKNINHA